MSKVLNRFRYRILHKKWLALWSSWLSAYDHARLYNGMYRGLDDARNKWDALRDVRLLKEWSKRTKYHEETVEVTRFCQKEIDPITEEKFERCHKFLLSLLYEAAIKAGIRQDAFGDILLTESNIEAYWEQNGEEIYVDDRVRILSPAFLQNGRIIEQGICEICPAEQ